MLDGFLQRLGEYIIQPAVTLVFFISFVVFAWGVFQMIMASRDGGGEKFKQGKASMLYGIIGMIIMLVASGIVQTMCVWLQVSCS